MAANTEPVLTIRNKPIFLDENWEAGIGGGLWSTGLALAKYFDTEAAQQQITGRNVRRVLELGSGNGFLSVCLLAACSDALEKLVITDTQEHLGLIEQTLSANKMVSSKVQVREFVWGSGNLETDGTPFDLIIGSDLAYRDELHTPLIEAILQCSSPSTITLLGVTMNDTKPLFFHKLVEEGLEYERLSDHVIDPAFRGTNFGIFVIRRQTR